jgi:hypothetical protein
LLSFLLPVATLIAVGFLATLCFTGLQPLWATQNATRALLGSGAGLLVLINAAYQDGKPERHWPAWLRWTGSLAALLLTPLTILALYGLGLRVGQHGWTATRVIAAAIGTVLGFFALSYALAAVRRGPWLAGIEGANFRGAWLVPLVLVALFTPIADPTRLAVASQVARLEAGALSPDQFDFDYLRGQSGGRYGVAALRRLSQAAAEPIVRERAAIALQPRVPPMPQASQDTPATALPPERFVVHPMGRTLPDSFLKRQWAGPLGPRPNCVWDQGEICDVVLVNLDGTSAEELIVLGRGRQIPIALRETPNGWQVIGTITTLVNCPGLRSKLLAGDFHTEARQVFDLDFGGVTVPLDTNRQVCPRGMGTVD